jgi:hypothetical protein
MLFDDKALEVHEQWPSGTVYLLLTGKPEDLPQDEIDDEYAEIIRERKRQASAERQRRVAAIAIERGITQVQARQFVKVGRSKARRVADAKTMAEASARVRNDRRGEMTRVTAHD